MLLVNGEKFTGDMNTFFTKSITRAILVKTVGWDHLAAWTVMRVCLVMQMRELLPCSSSDLDSLLTLELCVHCVHIVSVSERFPQGVLVTSHIPQMCTLTGYLAGVNGLICEGEW